MSRYKSRTADQYHFLPAFSGKSQHPQLYERCIEYLGLTDKFFRLRSMEDEYDPSPPWYQTVNMLVGVAKLEDGQEAVTSVLIFQAVPGRADRIARQTSADPGFVALVLVDYFSI